MIESGKGDIKDFNKNRAIAYNNLSWAVDPGYLKRFIDFTDLKPDHRVLDLGTGTGLVAAHAAPLAAEVVGLDSSIDMLRMADCHRPNLCFVKGDARRLPFSNDRWDRVLARMVLHHLNEGLDQALAECWRVLKAGGRIVVSEGVPPLPAVRKEYEDIFRKKEKRLTFLPADLVGILCQAGFTRIVHDYYVIEQVSVRNWLENSGTPQEAKEQIMQLHRNSSRLFKAAYRMQETNGDCLIDMHFVLLSGLKEEVRKDA